MSEIKFFTKSKHTHFEFTNFARFPITIKEKIWPTTEHYYQAIKFNDPVKQEKIRCLETPREAADVGRQLNPIREDWDYVKIKVMEEALFHKFTQHESLKELLLSTGDSILIEDSPYDSFWGCGKHGDGRNELGKALMKLREKLR